jgi:hypothetical protein
VVVPACNPSYLGGKRSKGSQFKVNTSKSSQDPHLNKWLGTEVHVCHPSYAGKHKYEDYSLGQSSYKDPSSKINTERLEEWLRVPASKHKTLRSTPTTAKRKKKKKKVKSSPSTGELLQMRCSY